MKYIIVSLCATLFVLCTGNKSKVAAPSRIIKPGERDTLVSNDTMYYMQRDTVSKKLIFTVDTRSVDTGIVVENESR